METLGDRSVWSMSGSERLSTLDSVDAKIARLKSYKLDLVAAIDSAGDAQELGARDTAELLQLRYRLDASVARRTVRLAQAAPRYPAVADALKETASCATYDVPDASTPDPAAAADANADGPDSGPDGAEGSADGGAGGGGWLLRAEQAAAIVLGLERVRSRVPVEHLDAAAEQLVGLAGHLSPGELAKATKELTDLLDSDGPEPDELKAYGRESLTLSAADNGVKFKGFLANENAELLRAVVHAGARPHKTVDGEHDPRPRDKRQADALSTALGIAAAAWDTHTAAENTTATGTTGAGKESKDGKVAGYGAKANITITIDLDDLRAATADAIGRTVYSDGLSAATIRRLACEANIIPLVLGSNSEPLDVGRSERLVTKAMRRALNARDRGCVVCGAPPIMCDAHHLVSWLDGGETKVNNLALLCRRHHVDLHAGRWQITIANGQVQVARPSWAEPSHSFTAARRTASPHAQPPRTAPPDAHPPGRGPGSTESQPTEAAEPTEPAEATGAAGAGLWGPEDAAAETVADRSRWWSDEAALREAAAFAATG